MCLSATDALTHLNVILLQHCLGSRLNSIIHEDLSILPHTRSIYLLVLIAVMRNLQIVKLFRLKLIMISKLPKLMSIMYMESAIQYPLPNYYYKAHQIIIKIYTAMNKNSIWRALVSIWNKWSRDNKMGKMETWSTHSDAQIWLVQIVCLILTKIDNFCMWNHVKHLNGLHVQP